MCNSIIYKLILSLTPSPYSFTLFLHPIPSPYPGYLTVQVRRPRIPPTPLTLTTTTTTTVTLRLTWDIYPEGLIAKALKQLLHPGPPPVTLASPSPPSPSPPSSPYSVSASSYVLKIDGTQEYLLAARPITQYKVGCV